MRQIVLAFGLGFCAASTNCLAESTTVDGSAVVGAELFDTDLLGAESFGPKSFDAESFDADSFDAGSFDAEVFDDRALISKGSIVELHKGSIREDVLQDLDTDSETVIVAPEPSSLIAFMFGLSALMMRWDRRRSRAEASRSHQS